MCAEDRKVKIPKWAQVLVPASACNVGRANLVRTLKRVSFEDQTDVVYYTQLLAAINIQTPNNFDIWARIGFIQFLITIPASEREELIQQASRLLTADMNNMCQDIVFKTLARVKGGDREKFVNEARMFIATHAHEFAPMSAVDRTDVVTILARSQRYSKGEPK